MRPKTQTTPIAPKGYILVKKAPVRKDGYCPAIGRKLRKGETAIFARTNYNDLTYHGVIIGQEISDDQ